MAKHYLLLCVLGILFFSLNAPVSAQPVPPRRLAVVDSATLLRTLERKYRISALILSDYQLALRRIPMVEGREKATEAMIGGILEEILASYATQLIRPLMLEINRLVAEKTYAAIINKSTFRLEDVLLEGHDARPSGGVTPRNPVLESLEKPFLSGVYFSEYHVIDITDTVLPFVEKHLQAAPLIRFSLQSVAKEDKQ